MAGAAEEGEEEEVKAKKKKTGGEVILRRPSEDAPLRRRSEGSHLQRVLTSPELCQKWLLRLLSDFFEAVLTR